MTNLDSEISVALVAAADQTDVDEVFMRPSEGISHVTRVAVYLLSKSGTGYTANSLSVELFSLENVSATDPKTAGPYSFYKRTGVEPADVADGGLAFDDSDFSEPIEIANHTLAQQGTISVRLIRTGGAANSRENYIVKVWGFD